MFTSPPGGELTQRHLMCTEDWTFSIDEAGRIHALSCCGKDELSKYKKRENLFASKNSGYVAFIPALPEETAEAMELRYEKYRKYKDLKSIIEAEMDYAAIHPFEDGNGRTGYFLMWVMMRSIGYKCAFITAFFDFSILYSIFQIGIGEFSQTTILIESAIYLSSSFSLSTSVIFLK